MPDDSLRQPLPGGEATDPVELFQDSLKEYMDNLAPYLLAALGQMVITIPVTFAMLFGLYFVMFGALFGGAAVSTLVSALVIEAAGDAAGALALVVMMLLCFLLMFGLIVALSAFVGALMAPLNASLVRRVAKHQRGEQVLDFSAAFTDAKDNLLSTIVVTALVSLIISVGFLLFYIPGIIASFMLMYAGTLVYLHRESPVSAIKTSAQHFLGNLQFHGMYAVLLFAAGIVAAWIPIVGPMFLTAVHVRAHRTLFGDGETAVM